MHSINISPKTAERNPIWKNLLESGKASQARGARIFRSNVKVNKTTFTLLTTSKDLALDIASMSDTARYYLVELFEAEFKKSGQPQMLVSISLEDSPEARRNSTLVTRTPDPEPDFDRIDFHMSPAPAH